MSEKLVKQFQHNGRAVACDRVPIEGFGPDDHCYVVQRVEWQDDRRARVQCYFAPEGFNTVEAYLAMKPEDRPDVEYFDQGKYDLLMIRYTVKLFTLTLPEGQPPVEYPNFAGLPDTVLDQMLVALLNRKGLPPGGTFSGAAPS